MSTPLAQLPADLLEMMTRGVSTIVGSRDLANRPSLMRAVGCEVTGDGHRITVYLSRQQARQVLQDVAATGQLAVVFSEPASHRTVQIKARSANIRPATPADLPVLQRYRLSMEHELQRIGIPPVMTRAMLAHQLDDLLAVTFAPEQSFNQTPGPQAGAALPGGRP